jgi:DnaJ-class molecular chaperone
MVPSGPLQQARFSYVHCPRCNGTLIGRLRVPPSMTIATSACDSELGSGRGFTKQCPQCRGWTEIVVETRP